MTDRRGTSCQPHRRPAGPRRWATPWAGPCQAGAAWLRRGPTSQQQRQQNQVLLCQTTSPAVAQQFWEQRDERLSDGRFEGRLLAVTVIFSDTCDFTAPAERLKPAELLAWFNRDMALWVPAITKRGGKVNCASRL